MAKLYDKIYSRGELLEYVGEISQFAGVRIGELSDGFERGVRVADFRTGTGFEFTVLVDRGMDIGWASHCGASISWRSPTTAINPAFYDPIDFGWLRGFHGGLLSTCGMTYFGAPSVDQGQSLGLHGRASYIPASYFCYGCDWEEDEYKMWVSGQMREATVFGEYLILGRSIRACLGESRLFVTDDIKNEGYESTPLMMMYHCNFGFPILTQHAELIAASAEIMPRDEIAASDLDNYGRFQSPTQDYREHVYYHDLRSDEDGYCQAALVNRDFRNGTGIGGYVRFLKSELPYLIQWKMLGRMNYVCGIEPSMNFADGRAKERAAGRLRHIEPGESRTFNLEIGVLASQLEIDAFCDSLP